MVGSSKELLVVPGESRGDPGWIQAGIVPCACSGQGARGAPEQHQGWSPAHATKHRSPAWGRGGLRVAGRPSVCPLATVRLAALVLNLLVPGGIFSAPKGRAKSGGGSAAALWPRSEGLHIRCLDPKT